MIARRLQRGAELLGLKLTSEQQQQLINYLQLLNKWNAIHNLTATRDPLQQVSAHLLDCLSVVTHVDDGVSRLADVGSGAGLPAIPLAIARPEITVFALESQRKKAAFIRSVVVALQLTNVEVIAARCEMWQAPQPMQIIVSRAVCEVNKLLKISAHLGDENSKWLLMKAKNVENVTLENFIAQRAIFIDVPFLKAQRHILSVTRK